MRPWLIVTLTPARLHPIARVWYADDPMDAAYTALRCYPEEILYQPVRESAVAGMPC